MPDAESPAEPRLKRLWDVMRPATTDAEPSPPSETVPENTEPTEEPATPLHGLWSVMGTRGEPEVEDLAALDIFNQIDQPAEVSGSTPLEEDPAESTAVESPSGSAGASPSADGPLSADFSVKEHRERLPTVADTRPQSRSTNDVWTTWLAILLGLASWPLSAGALSASFWTRIPAAVAAFAAIALGCQVWLTAKPSRPSQLRAGIGMLLGAVGLFLGPAVFTAIGHAARESRTARTTAAHLQAIGKALDHHHTQYGRYPVGGTTLRTAKGRLVGGHGWMTSLLPYLGHKDLYDRVNFNLPFDAPAQQAIFGTDIDAFFAGTGDRSKVGRGWAVSHFAGVGGDVETPRGELPAGIFTANKPITRAEITDGMSQTLIAGELGGNYPPWGDSENWRQINRGLNKDTRGFGNVEKTGAHLLFADGRVQFYSNSTDPALLRRLMTRSEEPR